MTAAADDLSRVIVGSSRAMTQVRELVMRASRVSLPVLILGETGTGKELVAKSIHERGPHAHGSFVAVNCASLPDSLGDSELFGHERGAFTGAQQSRRGRIAAAEGGTLFLDEVEDLSATMQGRLLRFLATGEVQRVGSDRTLNVTTRVVAAANRDLGAMVQRGTFRADLFYRLDVVRIALTPIRERREDLQELLEVFLWRVAQELGRARLRVTSEFRTKVLTADWPGNARELENHIRRCAVLSDAEEIGTPNAIHAFPSPWCGDDIPSSRRRESLVSLLQVHGGRIARVASELGVSRQAVWKQIHRSGLDIKIFRDASRNGPTFAVQPSTTVLTEAST